MLSGQEIIDSYYNVKLSPNILGHGLKQRRRIKTNEENEMVKLYQDNLRQLLSTDRISRTSERSTAHILANGQILFDKQIGKCTLFGQTNYLKPYEALYLMQINRLEIYHNDVIVSLEKAYHLLLSDSNSNSHDNLTKEEFLVFSNLMRCGYQINDIHTGLTKTHDLYSWSDANRGDITMDKVQVAKMCIWNYLDDLLHARKSTTSEDCNDLVEHIRQSMDNIVNGIKCQNTIKTTVSVESKSNTGEIANQSSFNSEIVPTLNFGKARFNDFMVGEEFHLFQDIFDKLDIFPIMSSKLKSKNLARLQRSTFSLSMPTITSAGREIDLNNCKIIVLRDTGVPAIQNVYNLITDELRDATIIFVFVSKEFSSYSFLYRF